MAIEKMTAKTRLQQTQAEADKYFDDLTNNRGRFMGGIKEIDGMRAAMCLWVYLSHVLFLSELRNFPILSIISKGNIAVSVFVMISGFAITYSLMRSNASYKNYISKRFFRIYPIYMVALILGIMTSELFPIVLNDLPWSNQEDLLRISKRTQEEHENFLSYVIPHALLIHGVIPDNWLYGSSLAFNGPLWSLSLEWQFYLVAPFMVSALADPQKKWLTILVLIGISIAGNAKFDNYFPVVPSFLPQRISLFMVGILTAIHLDNIRKNNEIILISAILLYLGNYEVIAIFIWISLVSLIAMGDRHPLLKAGAKLMKNNYMVYFGVRSYGFYALHYPILLIAAYFIKNYNQDFSKLEYAIYLLITFPITLALSIFSYKYMEKPINDWAKYRFNSFKKAREDGEENSVGKRKAA